MRLPPHEFATTINLVSEHHYYRFKETEVRGWLRYVMDKISVNSTAAIAGWFGVTEPAVREALKRELRRYYKEKP